MNPLTNVLGGAWAVYQAIEATEHNRRAREQEEMMLESLQQYNAVAEYMRDPQASEILGAGRMANMDDLAAANMFNPSGLFVGFAGEVPIFYNGDRHALSYGRTGSGKNATTILNVLGTHAGESMIVFDIKDAENSFSTAEDRKDRGHRIIAMNPLKIGGVKSHRYNPLQPMIDIAQAGYELDGEDQLFIDKFLPMTPKQKQADNSWALIGAREILRIRAKYLSYFKPDQCNPGSLWHMAHGDADKIREQYQEMIDCGVPSIADPAADYLHQYENVEKQYGGYKTGLNDATAPYEPNSIFDLATRTSDFDPADLKRQLTTVYLMLPTDKVEVGAQWLTLMASTMMERIAAATGPLRTTVILDEMANLPYMPIIPKALKLFRGKGVRMWGFCQGRHSLIDAGYTKETVREFEDQSGFLQLWEVEDMGLIRDIEAWGGKKGVAVRNANMGGGGGLNGGFGINEVARPVLQTEDIRAVGEGQQLLKVAGCPHIIHAGRVPWWEIPSLQHRLRDPREINSGKADWKPERRKRVLALPAPPQPEPDPSKPDEDEMLAFAVAELDARDQQIAELKERLDRRDQLAADLKDLLGGNNKGDQDG